MKEDPMHISEQTNATRMDSVKKSKGDHLAV